MPTRVRPRAIVEEVYGFPFPDDVFAFEDFVHAHPAALEALDVKLEGPFALISGAEKAATKRWDPGGAWPRFFNDPPEFFTFAVGSADGLHWGYWFDDPKVLEPVVVHYHHNDAFEISADGETIFHAMRAQLEGLHAEAHENLHSDPDYADDYRARIEALEKARGGLGKYALADRSETGTTYLQRYLKRSQLARKPTAPTRNGMGIVVPKNLYRPLDGAAALQGANHKPKAAEVKKLAQDAKAALEEGRPGAALALGHDLWIHSAFAEQSYELLDAAYGALGRRVLRDYLKRVVLFRRSCDDQRSE